MDDDRDNQVPTTNPARVLLVEDNVNNRKVVQIMLLRLGIEPDIAEDGAAAVSACEAADYDLILMDIQMPVMDGIETTRRIRALEDPAKSRVTIIALTANAMKGNAENYLTAGMNDYMSKPIDRSELRTLIDKWLK